jgi:phosphoribosylanthranilate isomerase
MIQNCKICGVKDLQTLSYIINHRFPPKFIGFICNWPKSKRFIKGEDLNQLLNIDKKKSKFVAVLVRPDEIILEKLKHLPFDYYQIYDCKPHYIREIKEKYNIKIITAITVSNKIDVENYKKYENVSDIILFDSKGYHESISFNHDYLDKMITKLPIMIAGDIKIDSLNNFKNKNLCIDISGGLETEGVKDINKIDKFLNSVHNIFS